MLELLKWIIPLAAAVAGLLLAANWVQKKGGVYKAVFGGVCLLVILLAGGVFGIVHVRDQRLANAKLAADQRQKVESRRLIEQQRSEVRPLDIVAAKAVAIPGVGGAEYQLWLRNDSREHWQGVVTVTVENAAGKRVAHDIWPDQNLRASAVQCFSLRGSPGDHISWQCKTHGIMVAEGESRI